MKKLFFIAAIAGAALVSCTKNELAPSATEQHEITFASPVVSNLTKADLVTGTVFPTDIPFYVFADYHVGSFGAQGTTYTSYITGGGQGAKVVFAGTAIPNDKEDELDAYWTTSGQTYYWPMDGFLSFYAYSFGLKDYSATFANFTQTPENGLKITDYVILTDITGEGNNQCDLMLSNRVTNQTKETMVEGLPSNAYDYDGVQIPFNHALSAIKFAVNTDKDYKTTDKYTITLKKLTIKNAYTTADLTQFAGINSDYDATSIWSNYDVEGDYVAFGNNMEVEYNKDNASYTTLEDANIVLLPQALNHAGKNVIVEIVYTVSHPDMGTGKSIEYTKNFPLTVSTTAAENKWLAGKRYIYTIIFGMEEIKFAPVIVADWADVELDINVPENEIN